MKNARRTMVRLILTCVCAVALSTANLGCICAIGRCGPCATKQAGCKKGCGKKASAKCKEGCNKPCCKKASAKGKEGCTKPCCKKA
jgi:hypothetical protein